MIVVALIAVLAAVAVYLGRDKITAARRTEVDQMFAQLHQKEEAYKIEAGEGYFLSTGASESDGWPTPPPTNSPRDLAPLPATWQALNIKPPRASAYCSYVAIAGDKNDGSNIGAKASADFGFTTPTAIWYYLLAECDFDGKPTNSFYFSSSVNHLTNEQNPGQ